MDLKLSKEVQTKDEGFGEKSKEQCPVKLREEKLQRGKPLLHPGIQRYAGGYREEQREADARASPHLLQSDSAGDTEILQCQVLNLTSIYQWLHKKVLDMESSFQGEEEEEMSPQRNC